MQAGKFGEHEKSVRVAESNSSFLSALQTPQVHPLLAIRFFLHSDNKVVRGKEFSFCH